MARLAAREGEELMDIVYVQMLVALGIFLVGVVVGWVAGGR